MSRVELLYQHHEFDTPKVLGIEGDFYLRGIGKWRILSNPDGSISVWGISSVALPRNVRHLVDIPPDKSYTIVRPTASLRIQAPKDK